MPFSVRERDKWLQTLTSNPPEVLVLGGGVVGASIAAHAAELGLNCVLVERNDFAFGASGNSTGLAHAGLRYLAQGRLGYVFRESRERQRLEQIAPHWVRPFNFLFPVYKGDPHKLSTVRLGTWIYGLCTLFDSLLTRRPFPKRHRTLAPDTLLPRVPGLKTDGLEGATEYFVDAQLQDSRFNLGWAQKAAAFGARVLTYAEVSGFNRDAVTGQAISCRDLKTDKSYQAIAPLIINATGAWIDGVRRHAGFETPVVAPSRGIHLVVDSIASTPLIFSTEVPDRVFFIIPTAGDASIVGTTDTPTSARPEESVPDEKEISELIRRIFQFFPYLKQGKGLQDAIALYKQVHVRHVYWASRPLVAQAKGGSEASRDYALIKDMPSFWSVPGVKLTAARAVGHEVAQAAWKYLRKGRAPVVKMTPLPGGEIENFDTYVNEARSRFKLGDDGDDILPYLISVYGTRYRDVLKFVDEQPGYRDRIVPGEPWIVAQAAYAAQEEMVTTVSDFLFRRTSWARLREIPELSLHRIVAAMGEFLAWGPDEVIHQLKQYHEDLKRHLIG